MRAVRVAEGGSRDLAWEEVEDPIPGAGDVAIEVHATAVNRADLLQRRGLYPPPPGASPWLGLEAAGVVLEIGEPDRPPAFPPLVTRVRSDFGVEWRPGDRVCALLTGGGYAEKVVVPREQLLPIPSGLSFAEAAALPEAFATAWLNLVLEGDLSGGETVLIHAGASGVGLAAIQVARLRGARVLTTVGSEPKAEAARRNGADVALLHTRDDLSAELARLAAATPRGGLDVVLDCLGGDELGAQLSLLAVGGRWIVIGLLRGSKTTLDLRPLLSRRLRLIGSTLRTRPLHEKEEVLRALREHVWPAIERGEVRPNVHAIVPIEEAERAHAIVERNENVGKVVLAVRTGARPRDAGGPPPS